MIIYEKYLLTVLIFVGSHILKTVIHNYKKEFNDFYFFKKNPVPILIQGQMIIQLIKQTQIKAPQWYHFNLIR